MFYIYHIPNIKIGCTSDLEKRMADQGFTEYEILEVHSDGWEAGDREIELQKQYGYRVDRNHYMISVQNRVKAGKSGGRTRGNQMLAQGQHPNQKAALEANRDPQKAANARKRIKCKHCGKEGLTGNINRWHNDNCKIVK